MRIVLLGIIAGCSGTQSEDPTDSSPPATTSSPGAFEITWEPDDGEPVSAGAFADSPTSIVVNGPCAPSFFLNVVGATEPDISAWFYFDQPPVVGLVAPLGDDDRPGVAVRNSESVHGGQVEVLAFADDGWGFRLSGDDLVRCVQAECTPLPGAELWVRPGTSPRLPDADSRCFAGEPYTWPNGWEACAVLSGSYDFGDCPETLPW